MTDPAASPHVLQWLPGQYAVCRTAPGAPIPVWAGRGGHLFSITRTDDETSIVCAEEDLEPGVAAERGWIAFRVAGTLDFGLTGVVARLSEPLAAAGIPIFVLATYDTDYVLVRSPAREATIAALRDVAAFEPEAGRAPSPGSG